MSTIDLRSGYWQVSVNPTDRDKTAITTPFGTFRFKRMPFGLKNSGATFQPLMDRFRRGLKDIVVIVYLNDIIVISTSFEEHIKDLQQVFNRLREFKLRAKRENCSFASSQVKFLGHVITRRNTSERRQSSGYSKFTNSEKREASTHLFTNRFLVS